MASMVFSFSDADDESLAKATAVYVRMNHSLEELLGKATPLKDPLWERSWLRMKVDLLEKLEEVFRAFITSGYCAASTLGDNTERLTTRTRKRLIEAFFTTIENQIDFEAGLWPEDISTSNYRRSELVPRRDDDDDKRLTYVKQIIREDINGWLIEVKAQSEELVDLFMPALSEKLAYLVALPADARLTMDQGAGEEFFTVRGFSRFTRF